MDPPSSIPPPPPPPPPSSSSCPLLGSSRSPSPTTAYPPGSTAGLGAWRLSRRRAATSPLRSKRFVSLPAALFSVRLSVEPQIVCPSLMAPPVAGPAITSVPPDIAASSPGVRPVNTQGPCSGPCCAGGPGQRHSGIDVCSSPGCSQSGTAPPVPISSCDDASVFVVGRHGSDGRCSHRRSHPGRTHSLRLYGEPYQNQRRGKRDETLGSQRRRGGSSTIESPRAETRGTARRIGGGWGGRSGGA